MKLYLLVAIGITIFATSPTRGVAQQNQEQPLKQLGPEPSWITPKSLEDLVTTAEAAVTEEIVGPGELKIEQLSTHAHAVQRSRFGYRRLHVLVGRAGSASRCPPPTRHGERWSNNFTLDTLADGRAFRTLSIVDDNTRKYVAIEVDRSLPGLRVTRVLERLGTSVGLPQSIVLDNGLEFAGQTLEAWA